MAVSLPALDFRLHLCCTPAAGVAGAQSTAQGFSMLRGSSALTERDANCPPSSRPPPCWRPGPSKTPLSVTAPAALVHQLGLVVGCNMHWEGTGNEVADGAAWV